LLFFVGADVDRKTTNSDHSVLSLACAGGHLAVVELLLAHGADPYHKLKVYTVLYYNPNTAVSIRVFQNV